MTMYSNWIFCFNLLLIFADYSTELEYVPASRTLDVVEDKSFTIGVIETDESTNITGCYYKTNTGISGYFDVKKEAPTTEAPELFDSIEDDFILSDLSNQNNPRVIENEIKDHGQSGRCSMTIEWVNDNVATSWTITPFNNLTGEKPHNLTEIDYKIYFFYKAEPLVKSTVLYESQTFFQYMILGDINLKACLLQFRDTEIDLDLYSSRTGVFSKLHDVDESTADKISSFGRGLCGFTFENAAVTDNNINWVLTATDSKGKRYRAFCKLNVLAKKPQSILNTKKAVVIGQNEYVKCGDKYGQLFCKMYNPDGKLVFTTDSDCAHWIDIVGMNDLGIWKCDVLTTTTMEPLSYTVELVAKGEAREVETWSNETDEYISIGCRQLFGTYITSCKLIVPNGQILSPKPGASTERYLAVGTNFTTSTCAIEIQKPLLDYENGLWRCEMGTENIGADIIGHFIPVGQILAPQYQNHFKITTRLGNPLTIFCEVPFSSDYCHIKSPNGTRYIGPNNNKVRLGRCSLSIQTVTASDNGTWACSIARETGLPDEEITVEVTIAEVLKYYENAEVDAGDTAYLMCSSGGLPLQLCRFISPIGQAYYIGNNAKSNTISYYGKGLEYGDCGISIANSHSNDTGFWTCILRIGSSEIEVSAGINLIVSNSNIGTTIGIAVGVVVVTSLIGVTAMRMWKKRAHTEIRNSPIIAARNVNDAENNAEVDIFNMGPPPRSYTNPEQAEYDPHEHQP